jgi:hypothetical protein
MIIYVMDKGVEIRRPIPVAIPQHILDNPAMIPLLIKSNNKFKSLKDLPDDVKSNLTPEIIDAYIYADDNIVELIINPTHTKNISKEQWFQIFYKYY